MTVVIFLKICIYCHATTREAHGLKAGVQRTLNNITLNKNFAMNFFQVSTLKIDLIVLDLLLLYFFLTYPESQEILKLCPIGGVAT